MVANVFPAMLAPTWDTETVEAKQGTVQAS